MIDINNQMVQTLAQGSVLSMSSIADMAMQVQRVTAQTEIDALRLENAMSLFDVGDIDYINQSQGIQYQVGTSTTQQTIFQNTFTNNIGNFVSNTDKASLNKFVDMLLPTIAERLETQLGKNLN